jgi:hypothetical protein
MCKRNVKARTKTSQNPSTASNAKKCYSPPESEMEHRYSYKVDIIRANNPYHADFQSQLPFGGYYINSAELLKARAIAFQRAAEVPCDAHLASYGVLYARIYFVDELQKGSRLIYDATDNLTLEICQNLQYEYDVVNSLGYIIKDWQINIAPDANGYLSLVSEFHVVDIICPNHFQPSIATQATRLGLKLNNK